MSNVAAMVSRELSAYFLRPMAYFVLLGFQLIAMLDYSQLVEALSDPRFAVSFSGQLDPMTGYVASSWMFWVALLVAVPALTMRLLAEERRSGTLEGLLTAPVTSGQVVVAKWLAGLVMFLALLIPFGIYLPFLWHFGGYQFKPGPLIALGIGLASMGVMFVAVGVFFSAITRNQVEAAVGTFVVLLLLLMITMLADVFRGRPGWSETIGDLSVYQQLNDFASGRLDLKVVALHSSVAAVLLFLAARLLELKKGT